VAVIQISKIQVRRGLQENLPQLASAELGWSIDERRLFIGNGTLGEGAPSSGNTELLTEYTDIMSIIQSYYFRGTESGYVSSTSSNPLIPTYRSFQNILDEGQISVRNFGAVGNGATDDTVAIVRALAEVYPTSQSTNVKVRRALYFPAGTYVISSELAIPPYAHLVGDGMGATTIQQTSASARSVLTFADSNGNISPSLASAPTNVLISGMTLSNTTDNDVVYMDGLVTGDFINVTFVGNQTSPTTIGTSKAVVRMLSIYGTTAYINFNRCWMQGQTYGVLVNGNISSVTASDSIFNFLYNGIKLTGTSTIAPKGIRVTSSRFDNIANSGIVTDAYSSITSAFNYYLGVGNGLATTPVAPVINYANPNNYSFGDTFDRTLAQAGVYLRIQTTGAFPANSISSISSAGSLHSYPGATDTISANVTLANTSLVISSVTSTNAIIDYNVTRGGNTKTGTMTISINNTALNQFDYEDSFTEYPVGTQFSYGINSPTGIDLTFVAYGNAIVLAANTSVTGGNVTFKYNVRRFL
jgi:hypothetical protein